MTTTTTPAVIVGAGLAGLIAAHAWPGTPLLEAAPEPVQAHRALLRFRSDAVALLTGVEFRKVRVRKGIWYDNDYCTPRIDLANLYSLKCHGKLLPDRSIWDLDPVDRFIAPDDFYGQLLANVGGRVKWATPVDFGGLSVIGPVVSTAPLPEVLADIAYVHDLKFDRKAISVMRFDVPDCDVFQTVYFPGGETSMYRASITGRTLIAEFVGEPQPHDEWRQCLHMALGLNHCFHGGEKVQQRYGKIAPIDDSARKALLFRLSHDHRIFSLGRFATWRNLLLDDVVRDIDMIKRLIRADSSYEANKSFGATT